MVQSLAYRLMFIALMITTPVAAEVPNLVGQIVSSKSYRSLAIFKKGERVYCKKIGDKIGDYWVAEIKYRYVEIINDNDKHILTVGTTPIKIKPKPKMEGVEVVGDQVIMTSQLRDYISDENILTVMMQAGSEAYYDYVDPYGDICNVMTLEEDDYCEYKLIGFRLSEIVPDSIYNVVGIQNGDIITHINGVALNGVLISISMLKTVKKHSQFSYTYLRNGIETHMDVNIVH